MDIIRALLEWKGSLISMELSFCGSLRHIYALLAKSSTGNFII